MKIELQLNQTRKFNKHYLFGVGSGHASLALRRDYLEQLKYIHDTLGIKRVRFHGIFCDDMNVVRKLSDIVPVPGADRFLDINYDMIGEVYDNILACGMEPIVELSFMPSHFALNKNQKLMLYYDACVSMPRNDKEWFDFIANFVKYLINRYGKEKVEGWLFEVWNEPDLIVFFGSSQADYFHLYEITAKAIKSVDPLIKVGGPSTSGSKWINEFLAFVKENNLPLDFISTHQYAGDPIANIDGNNLEDKAQAHGSPFSNPNLLRDVPSGSILSGIRNIFIDKSEIKDIRNDSIIINSSQIKNVIGNLPLYYTEWNENATFSASTNDTRKVSAFLTMTSLKIDENVTGSSVWCFSDIFEELHPFLEEFHGGFGLLTRHGIAKPSYYAIKFLSSLGDERYLVNDKYGDIYLGAFKKDNKVQILITRQAMKNLFDLPKTHLEISLSIKAKGASIVGIDENSANPLAIYEKMNNPKYLTKEDIRKIKAESTPQIKKLDFKYENNQTTFKLNMGINDTYLIEMEL